jgi:hypothetical protein
MFTRGYKRVCLCHREAVEKCDGDVRSQEHSPWIDRAKWAVGHGDTIAVAPDDFSNVDLVGCDFRDAMQARVRRRYMSGDLSTAEANGQRHEALQGNTRENLTTMTTFILLAASTGTWVISAYFGH